MTDYVAKMIERIDKRKEAFLARYEKVKREITRGKIGGELNRIWLDEQIKGLNNGADICCGDMLIDGAVGIDGSDGFQWGNTKWGSMLGASFSMYGDELGAFPGESLDFIVTNYIEAFPNVFKTLNEWHRTLKPGGLLAFCCADADKYDDGIGPFCNNHRVSIFTKKTVKHYLTRCGFKDIVVTDGEDLTMRVRCQKP